MKRMQQICVVLAFGCTLLALFFCGVMSGCQTQGVDVTEGSNSATFQVEPLDHGELREVLIPERVVNLSGYDAQELVGDLERAGGEHLDEVLVSGNDVVMRLGENDVSWWLERTDEYLDDMARRFSDLGEGCSLQYAPAYDRIELTYAWETDAQQVNILATGAEYWCAMRQLLSGDGDGSWSVEMAVYNSASGNLVAEGRYGSDVTGSGLEYDESDWERSAE